MNIHIGCCDGGFWECMLVCLNAHVTLPSGPWGLAWYDHGNDVSSCDRF